MVAAQLKMWEKEKFGHVDLSIVELRLDDLQRQVQDVGVLELQREVELKLDKILEREEIMWCQRSRVDWLRFGDMNTKLFHNFAKQCGRNNNIVGILGEDNRWRTGQDNIGTVFVDYFGICFLQMVFLLNLNDGFLLAVDSRITHAQSNLYG